MRLCEVYTEREIPGLGRNLLLESDRLAAIRCYTEHLERFHLLRILERVKHLVATDRGPTLTRSIVIPECDLGQLNRLMSLMESYGAEVERSKSRDENRGPQIIDDYAEVHVQTGNDPVVRQTWEDVRRTQAQIAAVLNAYNRTRRCPTEDSPRRS